MGIVSICAIIVFGLLLIMLETFLFAGSLIAGITGGIFLIIGLILAFSNLGAAVGSIILMLTILATFLMMFTASKLMASKDFGLQTTINSKVNEVDSLLVAIGDTGEAFGDLRLNGRARINEEIFDVESTGVYIESGTEIRVVDVQGSKIMVEAVEAAKSEKIEKEI